MSSTIRPSRRSFALGLTASVATLATGTLGAPHVARAAAGLAPLIGSMLMLGFLGADRSAAWAQRLARQVGAGEAGGVVFLGHNFKSKSGVEGLAKMFAEANSGTKALISLDQEGGAVQRLGSKLGYRSIPRAREVAASMSPKQAQALYASMASEVRAAGFNFNLAPVVDLEVDPANPVVGKWGRAWGRDAQTVTTYARAFLKGHHGKGVACALKHFPGHGSSRGDSHDGFVDISQTWSQAELQPFADLAGEADAIMTAHLYHSGFVGEADEPVTLSQRAIEGVLRGNLGYRGIVITDDLDMGAIRKRYALDEAVVRAIAAGNDIIMLSNSAKPDENLPARMIATVKAAVDDGRISRGRIEQAHQRIVAMQGTLG
ncbi:glycoside hydrolase family 3 N-terminal domain-containing protein [Tepidamorphus sp. 3E244]|uniref:glycoside hydrolase family 3 N-terminal domain-containing protein n=1 Tax=Tepidamorphus sp. 3E244 TaxID=3385498 RepID=UPI0038FC2684